MALHHLVASLLFKSAAYVILIRLLMLLLAVVAYHDPAIARLGCQSTCGNVTIPYPFGIGQGCFREGFEIYCNSSTGVPFLTDTGIDVVNIQMEGFLVVNQYKAYDCYNKDGSNNTYNEPSDMLELNYRFSDTRSKFFALGCDTLGCLSGTIGYSDGTLENFQTGCITVCNSSRSVVNGTCSGVGCCEAPVPKGLRQYNVFLDQYQYNHTNCWDFNPCSYAFVADSDWLNFGLSNYTDLKDVVNIPVTLDWAIMDETCEEAMKNMSGYACVSNNSYCFSSSNGPGYLCNCSQGFHGNPYIQNGCQDIDECLSPELHQCKGTCINHLGGYKCSCGPFGWNCNLRGSVVIIIGVCVPIGTLLLVFVSTILWRIMKKRKDRKRKEKYFQKNLKLLREEHNFSDVALVEKMKIYSLDELRKATNNFDTERIIGDGGHGQVYKGILADQRVVAIKRPKINEVFIISQTSHRNVVKFFGCCLESEVPLLVFEFISGGTLYDHLRHDDRFSPLSLKDRLRIAVEVARALTYLHSAASVTIFHRDVKSSNILLDERDTAKIADFGASRTVRLDQNSVTTMVQGTYGYLDPEYHQTGKLTDKSDVYSFGVILVELLTGRAATATTYGHANAFRNIVIDFLKLNKEDSLFKILDPTVLKEGRRQEVERFAYLAEACLRLSGSDRPTMKQVEDELESLIKSNENYVGIEGDSIVHVPNEKNMIRSLGASPEGTSSTTTVLRQSCSGPLSIHDESSTPACSYVNYYEINRK